MVIPGFKWKNIQIYELKNKVDGTLLFIPQKQIPIYFIISFFTELKIDT